MSKLILSFEGTMIRTFELNKERITIGRKPENDIQVDNLAVSGEHAIVTTVLNDSVIEDLNSTNGTMVNGQYIQKHLLKNFDVIELGKHKLKFVAEAVPANAGGNFAKTMVIRRPPQPVADSQPGTIGLKPLAPAQPHAHSQPQAHSQPKPHVPQAPTQAAPPAAVKPAPAAIAPTAGAAPKPAGRAAALQVISGAGAGRVIELEKNLTTIGKAGVQVAVFTRRPTGYFITHVEGKEYPLFNGEPLGAQARPLNDNDTIEIAGIKMTFFYKPQ